MQKGADNTKVEARLCTFKTMFYFICRARASCTRRQCPASPPAAYSEAPAILCMSIYSACGISPMLYARTVLIARSAPRDRDVALPAANQGQTCRPDSTPLSSASIASFLVSAETWVQHSSDPQSRQDLRRAARSGGILDRHRHRAGCRRHDPSHRRCLLPVRGHRLVRSVPRRADPPLRQGEADRARHLRVRAAAADAAHGRAAAGGSRRGGHRLVPESHRAAGHRTHHHQHPQRRGRCAGRAAHAAVPGGQWRERRRRPGHHRTRPARRRPPG